MADAQDYKYEPRTRRRNTDRDAARLLRLRGVYERSLKTATRSQRRNIQKEIKKINSKLDLVGDRGSDDRSHWEPLFDEDGDMYYYNTETGETSWDLPSTEERTQSNDKAIRTMLTDDIKNLENELKNLEFLKQDTADIKNLEFLNQDTADIKNKIKENKELLEKLFPERKRAPDFILKVHIDNKVYQLKVDDPENDSFIFIFQSNARVINRNLWLGKYMYIYNVPGNELGTQIPNGYQTLKSINMLYGNYADIVLKDKTYLGADGSVSKKNNLDFKPLEARGSLTLTF